jgi:hypothetical protein
MGVGIATSHGRTGLFTLLALLPLVVSGLLPRRGGIVLGVAVAVTTLALLASPAVQQRLTVISEDLRKWEAFVRTVLVVLVAAIAASSKESRDTLVVGQTKSKCTTHRRI